MEIATYLSNMQIMAKEQEMAGRNLPAICVHRYEPVSPGCPVAMILVGDTAGVAFHIILIGTAHGGF